VHHLAAVNGNEVFGYSHMMAVAADYQNHGVGAQLKWAQRAKVLGEGRNFIKWTFEPMRPRNAHFNLNRLGVVVREYAVNFYGTDYATTPAEKGSDTGGLDSDRLFASWELDSPRVKTFAEGQAFELGAPDLAVTIPGDFSSLLKSDPATAKREVLRVREEFVQALSDRLVCRAFARDPEHPQYLFYKE
jgi:predicted GNAT superfamily acetyltransferase